MSSLLTRIREILALANLPDLEAHKQDRWDEVKAARARCVGLLTELAEASIPDEIYEKDRSLCFERWSTDHDTISSELHGEIGVIIQVKENRFLARGGFGEETFHFTYLEALMHITKGRYTKDECEQYLEAFEAGEEDKWGSYST